MVVAEYLVYVTLMQHFSATDTYTGASTVSSGAASAPGLMAKSRPRYLFTLLYSQLATYILCISLNRFLGKPDFVQIKSLEFLIQQKTLQILTAGNLFSHLFSIHSFFMN